MMKNTRPMSKHELTPTFPMNGQKLEKQKEKNYVNTGYSIVQKENIPQNVILVDTKWVYDVKKDASGTITRYRARKVGRGFTQEYGLNYHETFSQMARSELWRILLTIAINTPGWTVRQWDVKAAYLQANLDPAHQIYVKDVNESRQTEYWELHKALYGLKQAGHEWYNRLRSIMANARLQQCIGDPGCFQTKNLVVSTHVDDMAGYGTLEALEAFEKAVGSEVELDKLGKPTKLLGMELTWDKEDSVKLTQKDAIGKLMTEHSIPSSPRLSLPSNPSYYEPHDQETLQDPTKYQSIVGSLLYISRMTRPDISFIVNLLGQRTSDPSPINLAVAREVCKYLSSTKEDGVTIAKGKTNERQIKGYVDA